MRNYTFHLAQASGELPGQGILSRLWRNWQAHRAVVRLQDLDDHLLHDIGVSRTDIAAASHAPLSINAISRLDELSRESRRATGRAALSAGRGAGVSPPSVSPFRPS